MPLPMVVWWRVGRSHYKAIFRRARSGGGQERLHEGLPGENGDARTSGEYFICFEKPGPMTRAEQCTGEDRRPEPLGQASPF